MYKALTKIGGYNVGDEVPANKAELWLSMYKIAPVEKIGEGSSDTDSKDDETEDALSPEEPTGESVNVMYDDYLNRNTDVVKKAIKEDDLNESTLKSLLRLESTEKKRKPVIEAIKLKMKSLN